MLNRKISRPARSPVPRSRVADPVRTTARRGRWAAMLLLALAVASFALGGPRAHAQAAAPAVDPAAAMPTPAAVTPAPAVVPPASPEATVSATATATATTLTPDVAPGAAADAAVTAAADTRGIDEETQQLKKDAVDLNRELFMLEEELLFPANTQVAVFVSMDVGEFFALDAVQLKVDDREVANYLYTEREAEALLKGGVHRVYLGNLKVGEHELVAIFNGKGPNQRDYRRGATVKFAKAIGAKYLELKITDRQRRAQPEFEIKDWE